MAYHVEFAESVKSQLLGFTAHQRAVILAAIDRQLVDEPLVETRQRKPLRPNPIAPWELRVGEFRVFYDVIPGETPSVQVLAVGRKKGNTLRIGGKEISL
jgi:mRNA-degrading endonuclease RelE of RelBE toxin-antitoxin system